MDKKKISIILGVLLAIFAVIGARSYIATLERQYIREEKKAFVLVATQHIPAGTIIDETMVKFNSIPEKYKQPNVLSSQNLAVGKRAIADIYPEEQIMGSKLTITVKDTSLAMRTPPGKRAMTITIDPLLAVGGKIRPGDYVDLVGIFPYNSLVDGKNIVELVSVTLFQNILILSIEGAGSMAPVARGQTPTPGSTNLIVTLALAPKEIALLTYALDQGRLRLVLRPPLETVIEPVPPVEQNAMWQYVFSNLGQEFMDNTQKETPPPRGPQQQEKKAEPPPPPSVEIYRGTDKSNMVLNR